MRRIVSFILVMVFMLSLACPAFAAVNSIPGNAPNEGEGLVIGGNPKTGDIIMKWVIVLVVSLVALIAAVVIYRKKFA